MARRADGRIFYEAISECLFCGNPIEWLVVEEDSEETIATCGLHKYTAFS